MNQNSMDKTDSLKQINSIVNQIPTKRAKNPLLIFTLCLELVANFLNIHLANRNVTSQNGFCCDKNESLS